MKKSILLFLLFITSSLATTLEEVKRYKYLEQTDENLKKFYSGLSQLAEQNNVEAILLQAHTYETGSHWKKDISKAISLYEKASKLGSGKAYLKLAIYAYLNGDLTLAKSNFLEAYNLGNLGTLKYLLQIAKVEKDEASLNKYQKLMRINNLPKNAVENSDDSIWMKYIEEKAFHATRHYIVNILKIISSLEGAFNNLGYQVDEYIVHNGIEPTVELVLEKVETEDVDIEMAMLIAGDNVLKLSILKSLVWANELEPHIYKETNHILKGVELEIGTAATAKIITKRMQDDS